jgi:hypothetical protein
VQQLDVISFDLRNTENKMRWRLSKLDFSYLVGELIIVILGVTIALAAEQWRQNISDQEIENQYIERLIQDIEFDQVIRDRFRVSSNIKTDALDAALNWIISPNLSQSGISQFLQDLTDGAQRAYAAGIFARRNTFDELVSTGSLGLISDVELRQALQNYYGAIDNETRRLQNRITDYSSTIYGLIPRDPEYTVSPILTDENKVRIIERAKSFDLESLIIAESNFGRLEGESLDNLVDVANQLLYQLRAHFEEDS